MYFLLLRGWNLPEKATHTRRRLVHPPKKTARSEVYRSNCCKQGRGENLWAPGQNATWALFQMSSDRFAEGVPMRQNLQKDFKKTAKHVLTRHFLYYVQNCPPPPHQQTIYVVLICTRIWKPNQLSARCNKYQSILDLNFISK